MKKGVGCGSAAEHLGLETNGGPPPHHHTSPGGNHYRPAGGCVLACGPARPAQRLPGGQPFGRRGLRHRGYDRPPGLLLIRSPEMGKYPQSAVIRNGPSRAASFGPCSHRLRNGLRW